MKELFNKYRSLILYAVFGAGTTLVNILSYAAATRLLAMDELLANALAWFLSVLFAYVTNRTWVFESKASGLAALIKEAGSFFAARIATGLMDQGIMLLCVKVMNLPDVPVKIASNVIVIILNYVLSKWLVFRKK